jgi:hypothetical protein
MRVVYSRLRVALQGTWYLTEAGADSKPSDLVAGETEEPEDTKRAARNRASHRPPHELTELLAVSV